MSRVCSVSGPSIPVVSREAGRTLIFSRIRSYLRVDFIPFSCLPFLPGGLRNSTFTEYVWSCHIRLRYPGPRITHLDIPSCILRRLSPLRSKFNH